VNVYEGYLREKKYGLMNQSFGGWLQDFLVGNAVGLVMGGIAVTVLFGIVRKLPRTWWLWGTAFSIVFMAFGMLIGPQDISIDELRRLWRYADDNGFQWISVWDHFYESPPVDSTHPHFEALTLMSAIACETKNARIGNYVFCMAYRNPAVLTKALVCIDHLSGGRAIAGAGFDGQRSRGCRRSEPLRRGRRTGARRGAHPSLPERRQHSAGRRARRHRDDRASRGKQPDQSRHLPRLPDPLPRAERKPGAHRL
jgi:hypothetical protein